MKVTISLQPHETLKCLVVEMELIMGYGPLTHTAANLDPGRSLQRLGSSGRVKAGSQWATVSPSETVDVKIFLF